MLQGTYSRLYQPLSENDLRAIHQATMEVLSKTGFQVENEKALALFEEKGAQVNFAQKKVRADEDWVLTYLKKAPSRLILYGREGKHDMLVEANRTFFGTGGTALNIYDRDSGVRRPTSTRDIGEIARLINRLEHIDWYCLPVFPNEVSKEDTDLYRFYCGLKHTAKHVMGGIYGGHKGAREVIRLAQIAAGGEDHLKKRPIISVICSTISPLKLETRYVDFIFELVKAGIPVATSCAPIAGLTSPITLAGTLVQVNAEAICGILLTQMIEEGAPVLYSTVPTTASMKTADFLFGAVENGIMNAACAQLAAYYNLPMYSTGGVTESKMFDVQNGFEKCMNNLLPAMAGAQLIHNAAGLIDSSMTVAYEQYVMDNEIMGAAKRVLQGISVTPETLAVDIIHQVGPGGNYMDQMHTIEHMRRELYMPAVSVQLNYASWQKNGSKSMVDNAREMVDNILREEPCFALPEETDKEILGAFPMLRGGLNNT